MSSARILSFPRTPPALVERAHIDGALATVDAALAVLDGDDHARWTEILRRFRNFLLWHRAAVFTSGIGAWQLAPDEADLRPLPIDDPAAVIASRVGDEGVRWIEPTPELGLPAEVKGVLLARHRAVTVYFEMRGNRRPPDKLEQQLVGHVLLFLAALGCGRSAPVSVHTAGLVGESPAMRAIFDLLPRLADAHAPVYIYGETGTGKERIAEALHAGSPRRNGPFVPFNASAVAEGVFEAELFGHVKGAFTSAVLDREGLVATAHGGTLFIDEIADLGPAGQAKLLRFLQSGEYRRVGENRLRRADTRVIAASNVPLEEKVKDGSFRADLLHRIQVLSLRLPPLRERQGDFVPLARFLLKEAAAGEGKAMPRLADSAWHALERYHWPGNVRELRGMMHRLVIEHAGMLVRAEHLPAHLTPAATAELPSSLEAGVADFERCCIEKMLAACGGVRRIAAQRLGLTRQGLRLKMKRLGIGG